VTNDNGLRQQAGRLNQKARTRQVLVATLHTLLAGGIDPSVADVAEAAGISRTTAYRYFRDQQALLRAAIPETASSTLLPDSVESDPRVRFGLALTAHFDFIRRWEPQLRAALRASLVPGAPQPGLRGGRAVAWYADALSPLHSERPEIDIHDLAVRLRSVAGIEPYVWLTDVGALSPDHAFGIMRDNAVAVLRDALGSGRAP
jgi:AcrR family transcriptional regulator